MKKIEGKPTMTKVDLDLTSKAVTIEGMPVYCDCGKEAVIHGIFHSSFVPLCKECALQALIESHTAIRKNKGENGIS